MARQMKMTGSKKTAKKMIRVKNCLKRKGKSNSKHYYNEQEFHHRVPKFMKEELKNAA
jgi:hypothetical protein